MKMLAKILITFLLAAFLCIQVIRESANHFLLDALSIHSSSISGIPVTIQEVSTDWGKKTLDVSQLEIGTSQAPDTIAPVRVGSSRLQWDKTLKPTLSRPSLLPETLIVDELTIQDLVIAYDADSEGGNLIPLRKNIADSANTYLRQRLNAANNSVADMPQRFTIRKLQLTGIEVVASSTLDSTRRKTFTVGNIQYTDMGIPENGISMPEIINKIAEDIAAAIHKEALAQGVIDPPEIIAITPQEKTIGPRERTGKTGTRETNSDSDEPPQDNKVKKAAKNTGDALKKLSRKLFGDKG